jgi:hypothetical protein
VVMRIQCFSFLLEREGDRMKHYHPMKRRQRARLDPMEKKRDTVRQAMTAGGEAAPGRENGGDDASWADTNVTKPKNEKKNSRNQFSYFKWTVKI